MSKTICILTPNPSDGTAYYRATGLIKQFKAAGDIQILTPTPPMFNWATFANIDLLYMHRPFHTGDKNIIDIAKRNNVKVWIDYDDDLLNIPEHAHLYNRFAPHKQSIEWFIRYADLLTVSTEGLKNNWKNIRSDIQVIENYIPVDYPASPMQNKTPEGPCKLFWRGSYTHDMDWWDYLPAFKKYIQKHKDEFELILMGEPAGYLFRELGGIMDIVKMPVMEITDYFTYLSSRPADIGLVPLEDTKFNRAKSNISWQEFSRSGMLTVKPAFFFNSYNEGTYSDPSSFVDTLDKMYKLWKTDYIKYTDAVIASRGLLDIEKATTISLRKNLLNKILAQ